METAKNLTNLFCAPKGENSYLFSFEGIEGSGKSTHITRLKSDLEQLGYRVIITREPGGTVFGEQLRNAILNSKVHLDPIAEAHLFASSRAELLHEVVLKELKTPNTIVIYDRYLDSSLAYQGIARGLGIDTVLEIHKHYPLTTVPHKTFYIRIDVETSFKRQAIRNNEKDYFESEKSDFYQKLILGYDTAKELFPDRIEVIDGSLDIDGVYAQVIAAAKRAINKA